MQLKTRENIKDTSAAIQSTLLLVSFGATISVGIVYLVTMLQALLLLSGDVERNPGPVTSKLEWVDSTHHQ